MASRTIAGLFGATIRGLGLIARFGLMIYLTRYLGLEAVGLFGLIAAAVAVAPPIISLGLHYRLNRELVDQPNFIFGRRLRDRFVLTGIIFLLGIFAVFALKLNLPAYFGVESKLLTILVLIIFLETYAVEVNLALLSNRRPVTANILQFIRTALWVFPFVGFSYAYPQFRSIESLLVAWLMGLLISYVGFFVAVWNWPWREISKCPVDLRWFFVGFGGSFMIFASDLGVVGSQFVDRAILGHLLSIREVGIFIFFWNVANGMQVLVQTGVTQIALPNIVSQAKSPSRPAFRRLLIGEMRKALGVGVFVSAAVYFVMLAILPYLDRPEIVSNSALLPLLMIGMLCRLLADVLNYGLYARRLDRALAQINMASVFVSAGFSVGFVHLFGLHGVAIAVIATAIVIFSLRLYSLRAEFGDA